MIGCIYRHPSSKLQPFCDCLSDSLKNLNEANKKYFILGDINIDLSSDTISNSYKHILAEYGVVALINKPTSIASTSATTLDHILTNAFRYQLFPGIINYDLTDHLPVFVKISCCIKTSSSCKKPVRSFANFTPEQFREDLLANMQIFYNQFQNISENNIENQYTELHSLITATIDKHAPLRNVTTKQKRLLNKPWLTKGLLMSIKNEQRMYKSHYVKGSTAVKFLHKTYANKLTKIKNLAKKNYYHYQFSTGRRTEPERKPKTRINRFFSLNLNRTVTFIIQSTKT